jgi:hypothetical protein
MKDLKNYQLITVKYLGATNTRGSRVKMIDTRFENKSKTIPFDYSMNRIEDMACAYLTSIGFVVVGQCELGLLCDTRQGSFQALI